MCNRPSIPARSPPVADEPDAGKGDPGDEPESDPPTGDDPTDETGDGEDSGLPDLDWTTTGTSTDTFHFTSNFTRSADGVYTDGNMSGTATQLITINAHSNRTSNSELSVDDGGEAEWAVMVGSGDSGSLDDSTFTMDASGPTTDGLLSGTATIGQTSHSHDSTDRTDTYDTTANKWTSTGTRTTSANSTSNNGLDVSGDEASTAGGSPITATRTLTLDNDSSFDQATTQTLVLRDDDEGEPDPGSDDYEWAINEGTRHSSTGSILTNAIAGTGSVSKQVGSVTLDYTLQRDDSTTSDNQTKLSYVFDTESGLWAGGGYQSEILDVNNSDTAHAMTIYTITNPGGGGTGQASHDRIVTNTVHYDNKTAIDTAPITMNLPELSGTYTSTNSLSNSVRNQTGSTLATDAGGGSPAVGSITTLLMTHFGYSQTYEMARSAGDTEWSDSGNMASETSHTNNFDSTLAGEWASQPSGGTGALEGAMSSSVINHNTVSYVSSGPLNEQGGYDSTSVSTNKFDHQNISSYSGAGSYDTIDHEVPISGAISYSRDDTVINTQNLTTTTAPDGTRTVVGDGRVENTHDSTRSAEGGGQSNWSQTEVTPYEVGERTTTHWGSRTIDQGFVKVSESTIEQTFGVFENEYQLFSETNSQHYQDDAHSTLDFSSGMDSQWDYSYVDPNVQVTVRQQGESESENHQLSSLIRTDSLTTSSLVNHLSTADPTSTRQGTNSLEKRYKSWGDYSTDSETENGVIPVPGSSNQYSVNDSANNSFDDYLTEHSIITDTTYGINQAEDSGGTTFSGTDWHGSESQGFFGPWVSDNPYWREYNQEPYDVTLDHDDESSQVPTYFWLYHNFETALAPTAAPSVSAPSENPHAATDQAISELTQNDATGGSPYASTAASPVALLTVYAGTDGHGGRGDLAERFPESAAPPAPNYSPETPPPTYNGGTQGSPFWAGVKAFLWEGGYQSANAIADELPYIGTAKGIAEATSGLDARGSELSYFDRTGSALGAIPGVATIRKSLGGLAKGAKGLTGLAGDAVGGAAGLFSSLRKAPNSAVGATSEAYAGVRQASQQLRDAGVPRHIRKQVLESFDRKALQVRVAGEAEYGIRYFDNINAWPKGRFLFNEFPATRNSLALPTDWNQMTHFRQFQIRPGTTIFEGPAARQGFYPGGQVQKYIADLNNLIDP